VVGGLLKRQPFATQDARLGWYIVLATIPAVVFGYFLKDRFASVFSRPMYVAVLLFGTALILVFAERWSGPRRGLNQMGWLDALDIGLWQVAALLPGISRSGATIGGAMQRGIERPAAARFSFLLSVPAMLGAGLLAIMDLLKAGTLTSDLPALAIGFVAAAVTGYLCIRWLLGYLQGHRLYVFAAYCALFGALCLTVALVRG